MEVCIKVGINVYIKAFSHAKECSIGGMPEQIQNTLGVNYTKICYLKFHVPTCPYSGAVNGFAHDWFSTASV